MQMIHHIGAEKRKLPKWQKSNKVASLINEFQHLDKVNTFLMQEKNLICSLMLA